MLDPRFTRHLLQQFMRLGEGMVPSSFGRDFLKDPTGQSILLWVTKPSYFGKCFFKKDCHMDSVSRG